MLGVLIVEAGISAFQQSKREKEVVLGVQYTYTFEDATLKLHT